MSKARTVGPLCGRPVWPPLAMFKKEKQKTLVWITLSCLGLAGDITQYLYGRFVKSM